MYKEFAAQLLEDEQYDEEITLEEPMATIEEATAVETSDELSDNEVALPHYECFRF